MELNDNFNLRVTVHSESQAWLTYPIAGIDKRLLDCVGGRVASDLIILQLPG